MKNMKRIIFALMALVMCLSLTACKKPVPGKDTIIDDIMANDNTFSGRDLRVTSFEITQRQTRERDMEDTVWVTLIGENEYGTYEASYILRYGLYNDGWRLDSCERTDSTITPSGYLTEEEILQHVYDEGYTDVTVQNSSIGSTSVGYWLLGYKDGQWWDINIGARFTLATGWTGLSSLASTHRG